VNSFHATSGIPDTLIVAVSIKKEGVGLTEEGEGRGVSFREIPR
jgi:hypothetical protein